MSLMPWIVLGLASGLIASGIDRARGQRVLINITLGIAGAVVGGWLFQTFAIVSAASPRHYSLMVALVGASALHVAFPLFLPQRGFRPPDLLPAAGDQTPS